MKLAEFFRQHAPTYLDNHKVSPEQARVLRHLIDCRTPALGGHADVCRDCGKSWHTFNSCRDRHCPTCQGAQQLRWIQARQERLIPTHHFHVVFTLPEPLRPVALANRECIYNLLFHAASATILDLAKTHWDAQPGITAVLHTWTRQMMFHPHLHCIVTGGGLADDDGWVHAKPNFLFPVRVMGKLFRGKFVDGLRRAYQNKVLQFTGTSSHLERPETFHDLIQSLYYNNWVVYAKRPFGGAQQVVRYLGRYTHRVALSSSRVVSIDDNQIVFKTKGKRTCALKPDEFIRRFLLHVLPKGFRKIRHYGLFSPGNVNTRLRLAQQIVGGMNRQPPRVQSSLALSEVPSAVRRCPECGSDSLFRMPLPPVRGPPGGVP